MNKIGWIIFGAIVLLGLGGLVFYSQATQVHIDTSNINTSTIQKAQKQNGNIADHVYGDAGSKVVLIEYGDFECPYCGAAYPQVKSITTTYKDQIAFIFRNFPLTTIHPNAMAAAAAAEAAGIQGQYWQMHDALYGSQATWQDLTGTDRDNEFVSQAKQLGLNVDKFKKDFASDTVSQKIAFDQALGKKDGVNATPTFFLNGKQVSSTVSSSLVNGDGSALASLLNDTLKRDGIALPTAQS